MAIEINIESQVSQTITDGVTNKAPSENAVFDALATKANTSQLAGLVPYTGAVADVDLGTHKLTAKDLAVNHPSGSGDAATITKGGSGEALKVVKSSGSGNAASITGGVTLLEELKLTTKLADAEIASAATWNAKIGGAVSIGQVAFGTAAGVIGGDAGLQYNSTSGLFTLKQKSQFVGLRIENQTTGSSALTIDVPDLNYARLVANELRFNSGGATTFRSNSVFSDFTASSYFRFILGATEVLRIISNNLLLGTTTNAGFRLDVNGTARLGATTVRASGALSTDIAFRVRNSANTLDIIRAQGDGSVFVGLGAGNVNTGNGNTANGLQALLSNTTGTYNTAVGESSLLNNNGSSNTANGANTLQNNTTGVSNIAIGRNAGRSIADAVTPLTITNNSVFLGTSTRALANNETNQIVIGFEAIGNGSNTVTLGNTSIIKTILRGTLNATNLPTSATGLVAGDIWNDAGTLKIV
jgi:hypothetical protein